MRTILALLPFAALLGPSSSALGSASRLERFELFNACRPMRLLVESLPDAAEGIGLARETPQAAAESRLRAARLYTEDYEKADFSFLYVNVNVVGRAFHISVEYHKTVTDEFGQSGGAITWKTGSTGTHGGNGGYIVSALSQYLDEFLAAYLRVNGSACGPAAQP